MSHQCSVSKDDMVGHSLNVDKVPLLGTVSEKFWSENFGGSTHTLEYRSFAFLQTSLFPPRFVSRLCDLGGNGQMWGFRYLFGKCAS